MSALPSPRLLRFLLTTAGFVVLLSILWSFVDSGYSSILADVASSVAAKETTVEYEEGTISFLHIERKRIDGLYLQRPVTDSVDASAIQFGLILVVALVAATPGLRLRWRFLFIGIAAVLTFALQVVAIIVMARTFHTLFLVIGADLFPALIWALFSLRYWLPRLRAS